MRIPVVLCSLAAVTSCGGAPGTDLVLSGAVTARFRVESSIELLKADPSANIDPANFVGSGCAVNSMSCGFGVQVPSAQTRVSPFQAGQRAGEGSEEIR